jgi:1-deoxy-D-xylulose-5-phosphate reductoisomerase
MNICILGATGSIGRSTLSVIAQHPHKYRIFALTAYQQTQELLNLCKKWHPRFAVISDQAAADYLQQTLTSLGITTQVLSGSEGLIEVASHPEVEAVMAGIVGVAGLKACLAAAQTGKRLMLANKEALVVGGDFFLQAVAQGKATLIPVDSEHSAIFQCLPYDQHQWAETIDHLILTASGGPFLRRKPDTLRHVTPQEACQHPNWQMGKKISVDSATMMNKSLEVIEARWLFGIAPEKIRVVIHPESIIHSMVVCKDQSVMAQLGTPDMKVPIAVALAWPDRITSGAAPLDFKKIAALHFEEPDAVLYPSLKLAWQALAGPPGLTTVLNAANEIAVEAFLMSQIRFDQIYDLNVAAMSQIPVPANASNSIDDLLALDANSRRLAREQARKWMS